MSCGPRCFGHRHPHDTGLSASAIPGSDKVVAAEGKALAPTGLLDRMVSALASLDSTAALCSQPADAFGPDRETRRSQWYLGSSGVVRLQSVSTRLGRERAHPFGRNARVARECEERHPGTGRYRTVRSRWPTKRGAEGGTRCPRRDLNPQVSRRPVLSRLCLPDSTTRARMLPRYRFQGVPRGRRFTGIPLLPAETAKCQHPDTRQDFSRSAGGRLPVECPQGSTGGDREVSEGAGGLGLSGAWGLRRGGSLKST